MTSEAYTFADWKAGKCSKTGWDCADAIDDGWSKAQLDHFMRATAKPWSPAERVQPSAGAPVQAPPAKPVAEARTVEQAQPATVTQLHTRKTVAANDGWQLELICNEEGKIKPGATKNWALFLENHPEIAGMLAYNEFAENVALMRRPPWDRGQGPWLPRTVKDVDQSEIVEWLEARHMTPKFSNVGPVIDKVAGRNAFHPVRDYLNNLPRWDGVQRLDTWLTYYSGAEDTALNRAFSRKFLCAAVRRVKQPGCKFDNVLVLQGPEDLGKSTMIKSLCADPAWFTDQLRIGSSAKETIEQTGGVWIAEMAELVGASNRESETIKHFLSAQVDKARAAYGKRVTEKPRQFVPFATTNSATFLTSLTGNRRWWIVEVGSLDIEGLMADRDQLWAEAVAAEPTEKTWLDTEELKDALTTFNAVKTDYGDWYDLLRAKVLDGDVKLPASEAWRLVGIGPDDINKITGQHRNQMRKALAGLGFDPTSKVFRIGEKVVKAYLRGDPTTAKWWGTGTL